MHYGLFKNGEYNFVYSSIEYPMISVSIHCFQVVVILPWLIYRRICCSLIYHRFPERQTRKYRCLISISRFQSVYELNARLQGIIIIV